MQTATFTSNLDANWTVTSGGGSWTPATGTQTTVGVPPSITSYSPSSGPPGTVLTITGTGFGAAKGSSSVTFQSTANVWTTLTPTSWSATQIVAPVPSGLANGIEYISITVNGLASIGTYPFTVN